MILKILKLFIICVYLLFFSYSSTYALDTFIKSYSNPLTINNHIDSWNETGLLQHFIYYENNIWKMIYASFTGNEYKLALAESLNGYTWDNSSFLSISETGYTHDPSLITFNNKKILFYAITVDGQKTLIKSAERLNSIDFINKNTILTPDTNSDGYSCNNAITHNGLIYLFFCSLEKGQYEMRLAISDINGNNFTICSQIIASDTGNSQLLFKDNKYSLLFHSSKGIESIETTQALGCDTQWANRKVILSRDQWYDQNHMISPSIVEKDGKLYLYYSGLGNDGKWRLNLAETTGIISPTPTSTFTPTLTPSMTLSPTPTISVPTPIISKVPIVIIPGMFASWNKDALIHNKKVSIFDWKLASFSHEYDGIIHSLKNIGYTENEDYFIFPYDWRKSLRDSAKDLDTYLQSKVFPAHPNSKINIVGHSLGGLVGRIYTQEHASQINKIISVGSPHNGVIQVYPPLAGGEIEKDNSLLWLTQKIILTLNKSSFQTDKDILKNKFPVLFDMLPTFDFLKKGNNLISHTTMSIKNTVLPSYNASLSNIDKLLVSIYGEKNAHTTPDIYKITEPNNIDTLLGNYSDGRPTGTLFGNGDYTVLTSSAKQGSHYIKLPFDHSEIITEKDSVKAILSSLQIPYQDNQIQEGKKSTLVPSLILIIKSEAHLQLVTPNNKVLNEQDGVIFVPEPKNGKYYAKVIGNKDEIYTMYIGHIAKTDKWETIKGKIYLQKSALKINTHTFNLDLRK